MKNKISIISGTMLLMCFLSCDNQDNNLIPPKQNEINYTYGPVIKVKDNFSTNRNSRSRSYVSGNWQRVNRDHLRQLSINSDINYTNTNDLKDRFTWAINKGKDRPAGVYINNSRFGGGQNPNNKYDWHAEFRAIGRAQNEDAGANYTPFRRVEGTASRSEVNRSGKRKWMELSGEWRIETTNETKWNVTGSISTEVGGKIGVPLVTEGSVKVSVGLSAGGGGSYSKKITEIIRGGNGIWVPAGKVANWELVERHRNYKTKWKVPLEFKGYVGADYGRRHHGHYFWAISAKHFFYDYAQGDKAYVIDLNEEYSKELRVRVWVTDN